MIHHPEIKQSLEKAKKNFNIRDCIGLSSLLLGLALSNSAIDKAETTNMASQFAKQDSHIENHKKINKKNSKKTRRRVAAGKNQ